MATKRSRPLFAGAESLRGVGVTRPSANQRNENVSAFLTRRKADPVPASGVVRSVRRLGVIWRLHECHSLSMETLLCGHEDEWAYFDAQHTELVRVLTSAHRTCLELLQAAQRKAQSPAEKVILAIFRSC